jgi:hypothetical protein
METYNENIRMGRILYPDRVHEMIAEARANHGKCVYGTVIVIERVKNGLDNEGTS